MSSLLEENKKLKQQLEELQKQNKALEKNDEELNFLFKTTDTPTLIIDKEGNYLNYNQAYISLVGHKAANTLEKYHPVNVSPKKQHDGRDSFEKANEMIGLCLQNGTHRFEWMHLRPDGKEFLSDVTLDIIQYNGKDAVRAVIRDISEQKKLERLVESRTKELSILNATLKEKVSEQTTTIRNIINTVPVRVFWKDKNLNYLGCNELFAQDASLNSEQDIIGKNDYDMVWKDEAELYRSDDKNVIDTGESKLEFEELQTQADDKQIWLSTSKIPLKDEFGNIYGVLGVYSDITERKLAEIELHESKQRLQRLLETLPYGVQENDINGKILYSNSAHSSILGRQKNAIAGHYIWDFQVNEVEKNKTKELLKYLVQEQPEPTPYVLKNITADGRTVVLQINWEYLRDKDGVLIGFISVVSDITEQKQNEQLLEKTRDEMALLFNISLSLINVSTQKKDTEIANALTKIAKFTKSDRAYIFEYDYENNTVSNTFEWCEEGISSQIDSLQNLPIESLGGMELLHQRGEIVNIPNVDEYENEVLKPILEEQDIKSLIVFPIMAKKECMGFFGFDRCHVEHPFNENDIEMLKLFSELLSNITEDMLKQNQLESAKKLAENANQFKSEFLANMSHEIRTPMNGILGFVDHLKKTEKDPERLKKFDLIRNSGSTLLHIINDILDFSKIESGKMAVESHPINIYEILSDSSGIFSEIIGNKNIHFTRNIDETIPNCIMGDEVRLKQIIFNLLSNAIKFTSEDGEITLGVDYDLEKKRLNISVDDTGIGIPNNKLEHIFESFSQSDTSTTRRFGGTGLGLTIASNLVQKMGGEISVESELGRGSKFSFHIPVVVCDKEIEDSADTQESDTDDIQLKGHVLIVEDNKTNQMLLSMMLDDFGLSYDVANDGVEGISIFSQGKYDVILMDENMPNLNGIEATKQIRIFEEVNKKDHTPIVAVTANALAEDRERFLEAGMDDYVSKPYTEEDIVRVLNKYLG